MNLALEINNLSYLYGEQSILNDISVEIQAGSFFIIIGPNGSGKTTLMKIIAGITPIKQGQIKILGKSLKQYSRKSLAKTVSFVPQNMPEEFPFNVRDTVLMGRSPHIGLLGLETHLDAELAENAMNFTGVARLAGRKLDQLSGGERQRVFIARAICQAPRIILLDEPTASLDLAHQIRIMDLMERFKQEQQVTVVMVSHDINLAAMYGDQLLLMKSGQVIRIGTPQTVITYHAMEQAYGCTLLVDKNPLGEFPRVTPVPHRYINKLLHKEPSCPTR